MTNWREGQRVLVVVNDRRDPLYWCTLKKIGRKYGHLDSHFIKFELATGGIDCSGRSYGMAYANAEDYLQASYRIDVYKKAHNAVVESRYRLRQILHQTALRILSDLDVKLPAPRDVPADTE